MADNCVYRPYTELRSLELWVSDFSKAVTVRVHAVITLTLPEQAHPRVMC